MAWGDSMRNQGLTEMIVARYHGNGIVLGLLLPEQRLVPHTSQDTIATL